MVTSVAIPAFDYIHNEEQKNAVLLGVAGTDVPIDSIAKLAQPHQVNPDQSFYKNLRFPIA